MVAAERAHGDSLEVSADSPEALDEVFWRVFEGDAYLKNNSLMPHSVPSETIEKLRAYVGAVLTTSDVKRYLSKNNNNILRLTSLRGAFPNAVLLIPYRGPVDHAGSLLRQHAHFTEIHAGDRFAGQYMQWLAHHEFGSDHRPFGLGQVPSGTPDTAEYWVSLWSSVYDWLLETAPDDAIFVSYEALCSDPGVWEALAARLEVPAETTTDGGFRRSARAYTTDIPTDVLARAEAIHDRLNARSIG